MAKKPSYEELERHFIAHTDALEKLSKLNEIFELLGPNSSVNIDIIVQQTYKLLGGVCCLYNRLDDENKSLIAWSIHNLPPDFNQADTPDGHICYEATIKGKGKPIIIGDIGLTVYQVTDPNVKKYGLKSYLGFPVFLNDKAIGSLCIVDLKKRKFSSIEINIISTLAKAVSLEEERKQTHEALRKSEEKYRLIMSSMKDAAYITSKEFRIEYLNPRMIDRIGRDATGELCHKAVYDSSEKCPWCVMNQVQQGEHVEYEFVNSRDNRLYAVTNAPVYHTNGDITKLAISRDITDQMAVESQLRQTRKMESISTIIGGIAHDFNNILYIITGNAELALGDISKWNPVHVNLVQIKAAALRAASIVKQLLSFSRKTDQELNVISALTVIKDALKFVRSVIPTTIEIRTNITTTDAAILADPIQINQILMNICNNAAQAMEETGGILEISVKTTTIDERALTPHSELTPGEYIRIAVSDTGPGIDPEILERIFDPYFTTKDVGKGSGMGLAIVHGSVKNHMGVISVDSQPEEGTTFNIFLPLVSAKPEVKTETIDNLILGDERLLFIDDEKSIINMAEQTLTRLGYRVETRLNPLDALELFQSKPDKFDLVITDMTMPQMTGVMLSEKLMKIRPEIPVIICSGHSALIDKEKAMQLGIAAYVMKPIIKQELAQTIRKVLDR